MTRNSLLNTDTEDLKELLSNGKSYKVPPYQRDYSWKQEHWEDLWEDLMSIEASREDHYMGAVVLESAERKHYRIIDGQQRMATLSILILACVDFLDQLARDGLHSEDNRERASELERSYLGAKDPASLRITPKLQLNANDDDFFQLNIAQRKAPQGGTRGLSDSEKLLWACFQFFQLKVRKKFESNSMGADVARFVNEVVTERLVFITVRVQDQVSAYTVFETLNARGLELTETDLLKNYLLSLADRLSKSQMEPVLKQWARITSRVGVARFPEFLRHHHNSRNEYVRRKQLFKTIKREVATLEDVYALLDRLEQDAAWFEALNDDSNEFWLDFQGGREHVRVLKLFNVSQFTPFVLAAKDSFSDASQMVDVLRYCAVLSVRFNGVGRRSTHILEEVYNRAALELRTGKVKRLADLRDTLQGIYVPDEEFVADFSTLRLKPRGVSGKRLRYLLAKIEKQKGNVEISDETMQATIEHILPENPADTGWEGFSAIAQDRVVERLGNYTLLERSLNSAAAGNASFQNKLIAYAKSTYRLTSELSRFDDWTEVAIEQRQAAMAKVAKTIWSLPL
ncbi:hypothetical protein EC9_17780 [Rosistilla ulvae]|uniref:DUF262 domain-containing protein n=1 Tax=Rosistilla ulvae TaxID=1930277 RepID=A0A517LYB1_9BACT|nr:DUF262 domain-containing protein [Rosistilla ulvae]QDS87599.1 hypothetical protein EC9_17780 [Rosistilla ulvae]